MARAGSAPAGAIPPAGATTPRLSPAFAQELCPGHEAAGDCDRVSPGRDKLPPWPQGARARRSLERAAAAAGHGPRRTRGAAPGAHRSVHAAPPPAGRAQPGVCAERGAGHGRARGAQRPGAAPRRHSRRPNSNGWEPLQTRPPFHHQKEPDLTETVSRDDLHPLPPGAPAQAAGRTARRCPETLAARPQAPRQLPKASAPGFYLAGRQPSWRPAPPAESAAIPAVSWLRAIRVPSAIFASAPEGARPRRASGVDSDPRPRPVQPVRQRSGTFVQEEAESRGSGVFGLGGVRVCSAPPRKDSAPSRGGSGRSLRREVLWAGPRCVGGRRDSVLQSATLLRGRRVAQAS